MTHAWCHDTARDAAVRAAEDGRDRPLPTLGEAIARAFANAAERSVPLSKTGEGQSGMRTERVVLEVVHGAIASVNDQRWWDNRLWIEPQKGESVRVVEEEERQAPPTTKPATTENDYVPPAPVSRPAETRQTQAERVGGGWWFPKSDKPSAPPPPPPAPPRVHRGSGVFDANGDEVPWEGVVAALTAERDAAIRERDAHKEEYYKLRSARITQSITADRFASAVQEADTLRARVDELEAASGGGDGVAVADADAARHLYDTGHRISPFMTLDSHPEQVILSIKFRSLADGQAFHGAMVRFFTAPPQPRGWLTGEEREAMRYASQGLREAGGISNVQAMKQIDAILARSSPPEVDLPISLSPIDEELVRESLAAAGVAVKEVGRE